MKKKLLAVLALSQVFFMSASYSKTLEELDLIDKAKHPGIACIQHQIVKCVVYYQTGVCAVQVDYYSDKKSDQPNYIVTEAAHLKVESGVEFGSDGLIDTLDFLSDGASTKISRAVTSWDFKAQKAKLEEYLRSGDSSNDKLPQCKR